MQSKVDLLPVLELVCSFLRLHLLSLIVQLLQLLLLNYPLHFHFLLYTPLLSSMLHRWMFHHFLPFCTRMFLAGSAGPAQLGLSAGPAVTNISDVLVWTVEKNISLVIITIDGRCSKGKYNQPALALQVARLPATAWQQPGGAAAPCKATTVRMSE